MARRVRLDQLLVQRSLAPSRERAQALILAGVVRVDGDPVRRSADSVPEGSTVTVDAGPRFVSRGGEKLEAALDELEIDVGGRVCLDIGSSTGGFTDCLLQRGASRVYAVDVGKGQLEWKLRNDPRVVVMEGLNARDPIELSERVGLIVADVSFISLRLVLPPTIPHLTADGDLVALVKPQFEAGREAVGKGGIVRDVAPRVEAVVAVAHHLAAEGLPVIAVVPSRLPGREGNREIFIHARRDRAALEGDALRAAAERAAS